MIQLNIPQHLNLQQCEDHKYHAVEVHSNELSLGTLLWGLDRQPLDICTEQ